MTMYMHRVGFESEPETFTWTSRDCSLYALAIGAGIDDVEFTTEGNAGVEQRVYPTFPFAVVSALADAWPDPCFGTGDFPLERAVLGEQALELHRPVATAGTVEVRSRVAGIHDKGSGALIVIEQRAVDRATGQRAFTSTVRMFVTGEGGFGGEREPGPRREPPPDSPPDDAVEARTLATQTLLYRHGGNDANPLHIDPAFARRAGWDGPILTGQNVLGFAGRALVHAVLDRDPTRLRAIEGRFSTPAYNGDTLRTEVWLGGDGAGNPGARFRVRNQSGAVVVDRGAARFV
jgi:acyl dehydratase